jgi:hypothetical protein
MGNYRSAGRPARPALALRLVGQATKRCVSRICLIEEGLKKDFPGWHIVKVVNLRQDDQRLWKKEHPEDCPGIAKGHFQPDVTQTALTVFKESGAGLQQMLLVASPNGDGYKWSVLSRAERVGYLSVVSRLPPGEYSASTGTKVKVPGDSIWYEAIEAGSVLYYFQLGRYKFTNLDE